jgi:hypothetical protein
LSKGIDGIAISPVDPTNEAPKLNEVAKQALLFTTDSDAPDTSRVCGNRTSWSTLADVMGFLCFLASDKPPIGKAVLARPSRMANSNKTILATGSRHNYKKRRSTGGNCEEFGMNRQTLIQKLKEDIAQGHVVIIDCVRLYEKCAELLLDQWKAVFLQLGNPGAF